MAERDHLDEREHTPGVSHEGSDVSFRGLLIALVALIVTAFVLHVVLWWMFDYFASRDLPGGIKPSPLVVEQGGEEKEGLEPEQKGMKPLSPWSVRQFQELPPEPRIEGIIPRIQPQAELEASIRARAQSYGWVDREKNLVHIPVDEAMKLLEGKLPSRSSKADAPARDRLLIPPTDSNSGRIYEIEPQQVREERDNP